MTDEEKKEIKNVLDAYITTRCRMIELKRLLGKHRIEIAYDSESEYGISLIRGLPVLAELLGKEPVYCKNLLGDIDKLDKGIKYATVMFRQKAKPVEVEWE